MAADSGGGRALIEEQFQQLAGMVALGIEAIVVILLAYAALTGARVDLALAEDRLAENVRSARPRITIEDLGSTNGVIVNGERVQRAELRDGSRIELGNTRMLVHSPREQ